VLAESTAIMGYLVEGTALSPADADNKADADIKAKM